MMGKNLTQRQLEIMASKLLGKQGFCVDGTPKGSNIRGQAFFEQRIIKTPMGNQMR